MANHQNNQLDRRPRGNPTYALGREAKATGSGTMRPVGAGRLGRPAPVAYRQPVVDEAICADCGGTGLRSPSFDPYCGYILSCRSCMGTTVHQDRTVFLMQLAFACAVGLATLAVVLL